MLQFLLIFSVACVHLHDQMGRGDLATSQPARLTLAMVVALFLSQGLLYWVTQIICGFRMDRGERRAFTIAMLTGEIFRLGGLAALAWSVFGLGWVDAVRAFVGDWILIDEAVACLPFWLLIAFLWWAHEPIERRLREAMLNREIDEGHPVRSIESRSAFVWSNVRQQMLVWILPVLALAGWSEAVDITAEAIGRSPEEGAVEVARLIGSLTIFVISPFIVRRAWKTVELGPGELRNTIAKVCTSHGVKAKGPFVWSTPGDGINAAVVGFIHPFRYLLISRSMLETFSERPLIAVVAHEVAHLKLRHMLWLGLGVLATVGACGWVLTALDYWLPIIRPYLNEATASIATLLITFVIFGFISRRFEWQADAFAVRHVAQTDTSLATVQPTSWGAMTGALSQVAASNSMSMRRWSWRHGSIRERCDRVKRLEGRSVDKPFPIDRQVALLKILTALAIVASYAPLVWLAFNESLLQR